MARQSLLWTTLPNGLTEDGSGVRVSVMVSPRLDPLSDPETLLSFGPDWLDWPATLAAATFRVVYGGTPIKVPATQTSGASRIDPSLGTFDSAVWRAVFRPDLFVRGYKFTDLSDHKVVSYDTVALADLIRGLYAKLATASATANGDLPRVSDLVDDPAWRELIDAVERLDTDDSVIDYQTGLRQPDRLYERFRRGDLPLAGTKLAELARLALFHTPPQKPTPVVDRKRRDDDRITASWMEHERKDLPSKAELLAKFDFHQMVSAINPYPTLLRRLGLVVDLILDRDLLVQAADAPLSTEVIFPEGGLAVPSAPDLSPITHARLTGRDFRAVSNPSPPPGAFRVADGLVDLDPKRFSLLEADVDGAGLKLLGFARSLARFRNDSVERVDPVTRFEKETGAPALRTAGLVLVQRGRGGMLEDRFATNKAKNDEAEKAFAEAPAVTPELWAEDLVRGFRFDVWDRQTALWRSLCRREARYELAGGVVVAPAAGEEEGTVRLGASRSPDPKTNPVVHLHEAVIAWSGWSLTAPPPGRAILRDDQVDKSTPASEPEALPGIEFRSRFRPVKGSLPRLRFGRDYWLRARAVDLAGNSLPHQERDFGPEQPERRAEPFLRYEPVAAPVVALVRREDGTTEAPREGESMLRIAIRSFNDTPADDEIPTAEVARRFAVPPQTSVRDAEQHGMLDAGGRVDSGLFDLLANQKDRDAHDPASALIEEVIPTAGPLDPEPVETTWAVYRDGMNLTYLPDPLAAVAAVRIFGHPAMVDGTNLPVPLYPGGDVAANWPEALPWKIEVYEEPGALPQFDEERRVLRVPLDKGDRATLRLSMRLSKRALREVMGIWRWLPSAQQVELEKMARAGEHWMLTPWRTIEIVHAVQRPLIAPEILKLHVEREPGATSARPIFLASCSLKSTDRVDLHAEWHEPSDEPNAVASAEIGIDRSRGDVAYSVRITDAASYATSGPARGYAEHTIPAEDRIEVGEIGHDTPNPKRHEFNDTRYRRIEYWLEATTRFREYLPASLLLEDLGAGPVPTDEHVKVVGLRKVEWVRSSAPPPAPSVLYVVPTFGWVRSEDAEGNAASWRRGGGLRVYLDRPWNVSGYGEMLGVVLPPAGFAGDPDSEPAGRPYKGYVTQWGNDPIWDSPSVPGIAPRRSSFPLARTGPDLAGAWLPADAPVDEADQPPHPFQVSGLGAPGGAGNTTVEVAPHDVVYDAERKLWYCDVEVNQGSSYQPFIRLALARYQPVSVAGAHLSQVVLADFLPLAADRWLNVNRTQDPNRRRVSVFGFTAEGSSGHDESREIAPSTVVEVWVERLDPSRGEDFGWRRESGAVVRPREAGGPARAEEAAADGAVGAARLASRFVPGDQIARGLDLVKNRLFAKLASERLVDKVFLFPPLWEGEVTLPPSPSANSRYRLVIAEYEEYLVDDEQPQNPAATKKGRRLVFVEHVELG